jgi:hypothetical protein
MQSNTIRITQPPFFSSNSFFFFLIKTFIEQSQSKYKPSSKYWMHTLPKQEELHNQTAYSLNRKKLHNQTAH